MPDTPVKDQPVVVNVNTAKGGGFGTRLITSLIASCIMTTLTYLVASNSLLPYALAIGLWWFGWRAEPPIPPGAPPPPVAVDPRFDTLQPRFEDIESRLRKMEEDAKEERDRSATRFDRLDAENARLVASVGQVEEAARRGDARASRLAAELERARREYESRAQDLKWLQLALINAEIKAETGHTGKHINAQCPECHAHIALEYPQKEGIVCNGCHKEVSVIEAWQMGPLPRMWKRELIKKSATIKPS